MHKGRSKSKLGQENITAREKGVLAAREFERVAQTFKKVLLFKEETGKALEETRDDLLHRLRQNSANLETLERNIEIYNQNSEKVRANLDRLEKQETRFREEYEKLLLGSRLDGLESAGGNAFPSNPGDRVDRETLLLRRNDFLENLKQKFQQLDDELLKVDKLRTELGEAREEIARKRGEALKKKETLEDKNKKIFDDVRRVESELDTAVQEECLLVEEFQKMVAKVESCLELDEKTDHVLFSSLTAAESSSNSVDGKGQCRKEDAVSG